MCLSITIYRNRCAKTKKDWKKPSIYHNLLTTAPLFPVLAFTSTLCCPHGALPTNSIYHAIIDRPTKLLQKKKIRINSIKRLQTIALALGEARTRTELIPFLTGVQQFQQCVSSNAALLCLI